ncbi:MAG: hypothetical protein FVQ81_12470 [Candidatus Glassbacteria bacterium]|nr:hypothetical protein [Candidatus Glassbacteria bacterium]
MKTLIGFLTAILLAICLSPAGSGAAVELKLNLRPGASYRVRSESFNRMVQSMAGIEIEMSQRIVIYYTFTVLRATREGEFTLAVRHEAVSVELESIRGDVRWDSNTGGEPEHPLAKGLARLVGESYTLRLDSRGKVLDLLGLDRITEKMASGVELPDGDSREMVVDGLREMAGEQAQKEMLGQLFGVYPPRPVDPGESWRVNDTGNALPIQRRGELTLREVAGGEAVVGMDAVLSTGGESLRRKLGPLEVEMELEGVQTGTFRIDLDSGWITHRELKIVINGSYSLVDGPKLFAGRKMPVTMESTISWEPF